MKEPKFPSKHQLENLSWMTGQAVAFARVTCSRVVELLEDPKVKAQMEPKVRVALETIREECNATLKNWED